MFPSFFNSSYLIEEIFATFEQRNLFIRENLSNKNSLNKGFAKIYIAQKNAFFSIYVSSFCLFFFRLFLRITDIFIYNRIKQKYEILLN